MEQPRKGHGERDLELVAQKRSNLLYNVMKGTIRPETYTGRIFKLMERFQGTYKTVQYTLGVLRWIDSDAR